MYAIKVTLTLAPELQTHFVYKKKRKQEQIS